MNNEETFPHQKPNIYIIYGEFLFIDNLDKSLLILLIII